MSLDLSLSAARKVQVYSGNITHNLGRMAGEAGIYQYLWRPEEVNVKTASDMIAPLEKGLYSLISDKKRFVTLEPSNGWGSYDSLVEFVGEVLNACRENPDAEVRANR